MKRKILSLVFAAAMLLGTATMTSAGNNWDCAVWSEDCGPDGGFTALVCGDTIAEQQDQLEFYYWYYGCL